MNTRASGVDLGGPDGADPVELDALAAVRSYPAFSAADDDFHDEVMSDRWWETETCWFSWNVPERAMGGWTYCVARPNARLCNGGVWVWDPTGAYAWDLPYHVEYSGLELPDRAERDLRDFAWPNGVHVKMVEPLQRYEIAYDDGDALELRLTFEALMPPNPHPVGVPPFLNGTHFDQPGHVTGSMVLRGERIDIDCYSVRDRSWGPRPAGRPKKRVDAATGAAPTPSAGAASPGAARPSAGIGYSFGVAGPGNAWLVYSVPSVDGDPVVCGFLLRDGEYGHILTGGRHVTVDPVTGWPTSMTIDAWDDLHRRVHVEGDAVSRHWRGRGGDTLLRWSWDGHTAYGEDQTYLPRAVFDARRASASAS